MESDHEQSVIALKSFLHNIDLTKVILSARSITTEAVQILQCRNQLEFVHRGVREGGRGAVVL